LKAAGADWSALRALFDCITNHYMPRAPRSRILSIRIEEDLLEAVRRRARDDGRSVSGELVYFVRDKVGTPPSRARKRQPLSDYLAGREYRDLSVDEFRSAREEIGKQVRAHVRRKARRFERIRP
jgi:hypothetical protein